MLKMENSFKSKNINNETVLIKQFDHKRHKDNIKASWKAPRELFTLDAR